MIRSMTGYGRKEVTGAGGRFTIELRSVNNRYMDVKVRMPRGLAALESRIKKSVQERFSRGRFDLFITRNGEEEKSERYTLNEEGAEQYIGLLRELKSRFTLAGEVDLSLIAGGQNIISVAEIKDDVEALWPTLTEGLQGVLDDLDAMRLDEGSALAGDISSRIEMIDTLLGAIRARSPLTVENAKKRLNDTLNRLLQDKPDPTRIAQEIALLAERTDITEELTRLDSHVRQFRAMMNDSQGEAIGRKLDFLLQEMGREVNTIASKAMDADISFQAVNIKAELEKIREQVQNIE